MVSTVLSLFTIFNVSQAQSQSCTAWKEVSGVSCVFAGEDSKAWKRDCSNAPEELQCRRGPGNTPAKTPCLAEKVCADVSPDQFESDCSDWIKHNGIRCAVQGKPQTWRRVCTLHGLHTTACTKHGQNYPTEDDLSH